MFARVKEAIATATTGTATAATATAVSPEKILVPALAKLQKDAAGRYGNTQVKKAAEDALAQLSQLQGSADLAFPALHAAASSKTPKYMTTALDCMEKLLARGFLGKTPEMATKVIKVISACSEQADDAVQLQVVKALLTAVTSGIAHESNLLLALRACYHIHLVSENSVNRTTSKVSLTQMMSFVFAEVEKQAHVPASGEVPTAQSTPVAEAPAPSHSPAQAPTPPPSVTQTEPKALPLGEGMYPEIQSQLGFAADDVSEAPTEQPVEQPKAGTTETEPAVLEGGEVAQTTTSDLLKPTQTEEDEHNHAASMLFATVAHKDAFLVLRTLSKLSMKAISFEDISATGDEGKADPRALKSKLLSLDLLHTVFEQAGPQLKHVEAVVFAIKQYLIPALMKNCMEVNSQVAQLAMRVFELVQAKFKDSLKKELELVISTVFLGLLDSPHASFESRVLVLETLHRMCMSTQMMMEIFLNYDCDWHSQDLLRQITDALCKASLTRMTKDGESEKMLDPDLTNSRKLRIMGANALAVLVKSLASYATMETANEDATTSASPQIEEENPQASTGQQATKLASAALDSFQQKQSYKRDFETAVAKFNEKPKDGIKFLRERGHLDNTPQSVAKFLFHNQNVLSKTMIGDYLGESNEVNVQILYAYADLFNFKGMTIDEAIRLFLSAFRIPGEAQKIDRVMEKFASKYWQQNQEVFPSADTAFVLSYAIIMLQTDAHNKNIKPDKKMKKADFLKNNRGIASGRDLSPDFLGGIYDRIVAKPITLKGDDVDGGDEKAAVEYYDAKGKRKAFFKERQEILGEAEQRRKVKAAAAAKEEKGTETFFLVEHSFAMSEHVAPMFMVVWKAMSTAFRANLLNTDDPAVASTCLDGMYNSIRVAGRFRLDDERAALIEMLAGLSRLDAPLEIEPKNVMCVQAITAIAITEGNYIGSSWGRILQCVSELSRLLLMTPTGEDDSVVDIPTNDQSMSGSKKRGPPPTIDPIMKAQTALKRVLDYTAVDRIFVQSVSLNEQAIVDFVDALTEVSRAELLLKSASSQAGGLHPLKRHPSGSSQPRARLFALQKIVEVADFNIDTRPRYTWGRVWETLSQLFAESGCHASPQVAMYAVDSLKQLSLKFLNKEEFEGFAFQDRFLRPFEQIMKHSRSPDVRALVLHCMQNFIVAKSKSIKSGWGAVFDVIAASAKDPVQENMNLGFNLLEMSQQYNAPPFLFAQGALKFAHANDAGLSTKCLEFAEAYAGSAYSPDVSAEQSEHGDSPQKARELFTGLSAFSTADPRENVRRQALTSVFTILKNALEDRADPVVVSKLFVEDVLNPWNAVFFGTSDSSSASVAVSSLVGGPKWPFSTLSYVTSELIRFLALALYEVDNLPELSPEDFAKKRTGGPEDDGDIPLNGKLASHTRETAFAPLLDAAFKFFERLSGKGDRAVSAVGVASYNYAMDVLGSHFSSKAWKMLLESLSNAIKATSPAHLNTPDALRALGLLGNLSADEDETKITSLSLDELSQQTPDGGVFLPGAKRISPTNAGSKESAQQILPSPSPPTETTKVSVPQVPDLKAAEVRVVSNLGLVKIICRILRRPFEKVEISAKTCDILEHALTDASAFDDNHPLRIELSRRGFVKEGSEKPQKEGIIKPLVPPDALEVEVLSAQTLLKYMQTQTTRDEQRFERVLVGLVNRYLHQDRILAAEQTFKPKTSSGPSVQTVGTTKSESEKELLALTPVVLFALRGVLELEGSPVDRALPWVFPLLLQLIECPNRDVRAIVRRILEKHVTSRLNFQKA